MPPTGGSPAACLPRVRAEATASILEAGAGTQPSSANRRAASLTTYRASGYRDVFLLDSTPARSALSTGPASLGVLPPTPTLSARPFKLSNTLLQGLLAGGAGRQPYGGGVLGGAVVRDCARHVTDERQPSRDVMMLSGGGAQSLALLGLEAGAEGAVLALYLAFPTPTPRQLLEALQASCGALLSRVLGPQLRQRLRGPELGAEWETLLAGVPGAYVSVSRGGPPAAAGGGIPLAVEPASLASESLLPPSSPAPLGSSQSCRRHTHQHPQPHPQQQHKARAGPTTSLLRMLGSSGRSVATAPNGAGDACAAVGANGSEDGEEEWPPVCEPRRCSL